MRRASALRVVASHDSPERRGGEDDEALETLTTDDQVANSTTQNTTPAVAYTRLNDQSHRITDANIRRRQTTRSTQSERCVRVDERHRCVTRLALADVQD